MWGRCLPAIKGAKAWVGVCLSNCGAEGGHFIGWENLASISYFKIKGFQSIILYGPISSGPSTSKLCCPKKFMLVAKDQNDIKLFNWQMPNNKTNSLTDFFYLQIACVGIKQKPLHFKLSNPTCGKHTCLSRMMDHFKRSDRDIQMTDPLHLMFGSWATKDIYLSPAVLQQLNTWERVYLFSCINSLNYLN